MERQHWTVIRQQVGHPAAQRRWDRAYQLLVQMAATVQPDKTDVPTAGDAIEESHDASRRLCPGLDPAPSPGANY
jgi:hypothetical protein